MQNISSDEKHRFGVATVIFARKWRQVLDQKLSESGLSDASWVPLIYLLRIGDGILQRELAAAAGLDDSSLVRHLDNLSASGLLERRIDPADRRARRLHLTEAGRQRAEQVQAQLLAIEGEMLADVSAAELAAALDLFGRVERRLEEMRCREDGK